MTGSTGPTQLLRLDLGCGNAKREGFVGLDSVPGPAVDHVLDLTVDQFPFPDDSVDEVFSAHFLEHIESPNHLFGEIGRTCRDRARIEFWTPYAFTNEAFLYGHLHGITEEMWLHLGVSHRDIYAPMLQGRWQLLRFVYVIDQTTIDDLNAHDVELDFAVRYFKGVVKELGVEIEYRQDLSAPLCFPQRVYAASRFGDRLALVSSAPKAKPARGSVGRLRSAARKLVPRR